MKSWSAPKIATQDSKNEYSSDPNIKIPPSKDRVRKNTKEMTPSVRERKSVARIPWDGRVGRQVIMLFTHSVQHASVES